MNRSLGVVVAVALSLVVACSGGSSTSSSSSTGGGTGGGCTGPRDCPGGFACRARSCVASCPVNSTVTGCVVGATCTGGTCVNNTTCGENTDCAFDKGEVCDFAQGRCVTAQDACVEGETETLCGNGYTCHVSVCHFNCSGSKGCPSTKACQANHTCQ